MQYPGDLPAHCPRIIRFITDVGNDVRKLERAGDRLYTAQCDAGHRDTGQTGERVAACLTLCCMLVRILEGDSAGQSVRIGRESLGVRCTWRHLGPVIGIGEHHAALCLPNRESLYALLVEVFPV